MINLIYTECGDEFSKWVEKVIKDRNKKMAEDKNLNILMDPEIAKVFKASTTISCK